MKKIFLLLVCIFLSIGCAEQKEKPKPWTAIAREVIKSVVLIHGYNKENQAIGGSGFVIASNGYILTNNHVIEGMDSSLGKPIVSVEFNDNTKFLVQDFWSNKLYDLAVLKINTNNLSPLSFEEQRNPQIGEEVMLFGSVGSVLPFAVQGIVARSELLLAEEVYRKKNLKSNFIQFSMVINHGFSGGPIVNKFGKVMAISQGSSSTVYSVGVGISSKDAIKVLPSLFNKIIEIDSKTSRRTK